MTVLDFLFEGKAPKSVDTYGQTVENVPKWMSDYTQGLIARANAAAAEPYIPYGGPRIAGFDPNQEAAFGLTEENVGSYQPYLEGSAQGYAGGLEAAAGIPGAAQPYLDEASGRWTDPGTSEAYMNPYIENVLNRNESLAQRTLEEDFLPGLQKTFAGAGQYGSRGGTGSMEDIGVRGVRDITEGLNEQNLAALSGAYGQAADIYGGEQGRQAELGRIRGGLEEARASGMYQGAQGLAGLGSEAQRMGITDAAALEAVGQQGQAMDQRSLDLAYGDFQEQRNLPFERTGFMSDIIRGLPSNAVPTSTSRHEYGPADVYQPSGLSQLAGAYGVYQGMGGGRARGGRIERRRRRKYQGGGPVVGGLSEAAYTMRPDYGRTLDVAGGVAA